jgi:hypothetical protein
MTYPIMEGLFVSRAQHLRGGRPHQQNGCASWIVDIRKQQGLSLPSTAIASSIQRRVPPKEIVGFLTKALPEVRPMKCLPPLSGLFAVCLLPFLYQANARVYLFLLGSSSGWM